MSTTRLSHTSLHVVHSPTTILSDEPDTPDTPYSTPNESLFIPQPPSTDQVHGCRDQDQREREELFGQVEAQQEPMGELLVRGS